MCCPYTDEDECHPAIPREDVENAVRKAVINQQKNGKDKVSAVLSGGEPTLYAELPLLIKNLQEMGASVHILSNGERFADREFLKQLDETIDWSTLSVTTTLHSQRSEIHEQANRKKGSFQRTLDGLHRIDERKAHVTVKHCITGSNYRDLCAFYKFVDAEFGKHIPLYLCGIDYIGVPKERIQTEKIGLPEIRPMLEQMFDLMEKDKEHRRVYATHIPLCWTDPYYWKYLTFNRPDFMYHASGRYGEINWEANSDSGIRKNICLECKVNQLCMGTYFSAFDALGKDGFHPFIF
jgi:MoaA/NifB/PqqE/SkfB family radical SAM enzyme